MNDSTHFIDVVAGIIYNPSKTALLLALRKPEQHQGNCWEFPGGKIEANETIAHALHRELREELGISTVHVNPYCKIEHRYVDKAVRLHFWQVMEFTGAPVGRENQQLRWVLIEELSELSFPEANKPVVARLLQAESTYD